MIEMSFTNYINLKYRKNLNHQTNTIFLLLNVTIVNLEAFLNIKNVRKFKFILSVKNIFYNLFLI